MDIAIVMATYKKKDGSTPGFVKKAIASLTQQTYQNFKLFLIGDQYTDNDEFESFRSLLPPEQLYMENRPYAVERNRYEPGELLWNCGGVTSMNYGIDTAKAHGYQYVAFLDHDDIWFTDHLELLVRTIKLTNAPLIASHGIYLGARFPNEVGDNFLYNRLSINSNAYYILNPDIKVWPMIPYEASYIKSTVCIDVTRIHSRMRDTWYEIGEKHVCDADWWMQIREEVLTGNLDYGVLIGKITVDHSIEGAAKKSK